MEKLPIEIIFKVLLFIPNVRKYSILNKNFMLFIKELIKYYRKKFNAISNDWKNDPSDLINSLIYKNDIDSIRFLANNYNVQKIINFYAAYYNNLEILNFIKPYYQEIANGAAKGGNINLLKNAIENGATNYDEILKFSIESGKLSIIKYIISFIHNFDDYNYIAYIGSLDGHLKVIKYAIKNGANNYQQIARTAALYGNLEIIKYVIENVTDINIIAKNAAEGGHLDIVKYAINRGANNLSEIAYYSARYGNFDIIKSINVTNYNDIAIGASLGMHFDILKWALLNGATNYEDILNTICRNVPNEIIRLIFSLIKNGNNS